MSFESINYLFIPSRLKTKLLESVIIDYGAVFKINDGIFREYVIFESEKYWIDVQIEHHIDINFDSASVRIALCNPPQVLDKIGQLFSHLINTCGGYVAIWGSEQKIRSDDADSIAFLKNGYLEKQKEFRKYHGGFTAAISGGEVYAYMREHNIATRDPDADPLNSD